MYNLSVSDINSYVAGVGYNVSGHCIIDASCICSTLSLFPGSSGKADAKVQVYALDKPGAVCPIGKACSAVNVGIAYEFKGVIGNVLSQAVVCRWLVRGAVGRGSCLL